MLSIDKGTRASAVGGNSLLYTLVFAVAPVLALALAGIKQKKSNQAANQSG